MNRTVNRTAHRVVPIVRLEVRRQTPVYATLSVGLGCLFGYALVTSRSELARFLLGMYIMMTASGLCVWSAVRLGQYWLFGGDVLLQLPPVRRMPMLVLKATVSGVLMYLYFVLYTLAGNGWVNAREAGVSLVSKALSIGSFFALVICLLVFTKRFRRAQATAFVALGTYVALTIVGAIVWWSIVKRPGAYWNLGVDTHAAGLNSYVNILPILVGPVDAGSYQLVDSPQLVAVTFNVVTVAAASCLAWLGSRHAKFDFYSRLG